MDYCKIKHATDAIASCIVLHNICEARGDLCDPGWIYHEDYLSATATRTATSSQSCTARLIRDTLSEYLYENQQ